MSGHVEVHQFEQLGGALFPEGVQGVHETELRLPLFDSDSVLLHPAHVSLIGHIEATPAFVPRVGPILQIEPVAFFDASARVYGTYFLGTFSGMIPTDDPNFTGSKAGRRALVDAGARRPGFDLRVDLNARLKGRVGPVIAVLELEGRHHHTRTVDGDFPYWWDPSEMLTVASDGWVIDRKAYLFFELLHPAEEGDRKLWIGEYTDWMASPSTGDESLRSGPIVMWKPNDQPAMPTFIVGGFVWAQSRFAEKLPPYTVIAAQWAR